MNKFFNTRLLLVILFPVIICSCNYDEIADADYPPSLIYLPSAVDGIATNGIYTINEGASTTWVSPTEGQPLKYSIVNNENKFIIPLGIYRSGTEKTISGTARVDISINQNIVRSMMDENLLDAATELLPVDKFVLPASAQLEGGKNYSFFDMVIDLNYIAADPAKKYAIGFTISNNDNNVNLSLNTAVILIDARITAPTSDFRAQVVGSSTHIFSFTNSSLYWDYFGENAFTWDFGDGTISHEINPQHTYTESGQKTVTLTVRGITGKTATSSRTVRPTVPD